MAWRQQRQAHDKSCAVSNNLYVWRAWKCVAYELLLLPLSLLLALRIGYFEELDTRDLDEDRVCTHSVSEHWLAE